jgi:hypothetical protein
MPYSDYTQDPPVTILLPHEVKELPLLKEAPIGTSSGLDFGDGDNVIKGPQYNAKDLFDHTKRMMQLMMINYDRPTDIPYIKNIPEHVKQELKPFAYFLAIMDGNNCPDLIDQYIPEVYAFMTNSGHTFIDEALENIKEYSKSDK